MKQQQPTIRILLLDKSLNTFPEKPDKYQASIFTEHSDHHGIGATPAEALFNAAAHWHFRGSNYD